MVIFDLQSVSRGGAGVIHRYAGARLTIRVTFHLISASSHDWKRGRCRTPRTPEAAILGHFVEIQTFLAEHQKSGGGAISRGNGDVKEWEKL